MVKKKFSLMIFFFILEIWPQQLGFVGETTENHPFFLFYYNNWTISLVAEPGLSFPLAPDAFLPARPAFSGFTARMQVNFVQKTSTLASMCFEC